MIVVCRLLGYIAPSRKSDLQRWVFWEDKGAVALVID